MPQQQRRDKTMRVGDPQVKQTSKHDVFDFFRKQADADHNNFAKACPAECAMYGFRSR